MIDFTKLEEALNRLQEALANKTQNELERDGTIKRFEYSFELSWKMAKKVLADQGINENSPKAVIRRMGQLDWINSVELWIELQETRNLTSHTYAELYAKKAYDSCPLFLKEAKKLLAKLKEVQASGS